MLNPMRAGAALLLLSMAGGAQAATYVRDAVVDLGQNPAGTILSRLDADQTHVAFAPTPALADGDVVSGSVSFANSGRVTLYDDARETVQFWLANTALHSGNVSSTFRFTGVQGTLKAANLFTSFNTGCCAAAGPSSVDLTDDSFSFSGFDYEITFLSGTAGTYDGYTFFTSRASYAPDVTAGVPEPASWAMMLLGFGGLGNVLRRRASPRARIRFA